MLSIVVVDAGAASRSKIVAELNELMRHDISDICFLPRLSIKPMAQGELRFNSAPDICIVGDEMLSRELSSVAQIKRLLPDTAVVARTTAALSSLSTIEQLARLGADDTMAVGISPEEFFRKIIMLARRRSATSGAKLILVDGGKGGVGTTSLAAALGELIVEQGKRAALMDLDFETQDLSRFMRARPYINENLQLLLDDVRPVTREFVEQCLVQVWEGDDRLVCVPPVADADDLYDGNSKAARTIVAVLEVLDTIFDFVIVDAANIRGNMRRSLYRVADKAIFVVNNDPAALFAAVDRVARSRALMAPNAGLLVVENSLWRSGLDNRFLREEFYRAANLSDKEWCRDMIPPSRAGSRWPGSGSTLYTISGRPVQRALHQVVKDLGLFELLPKETHTDGCRARFPALLSFWRGIGRKGGSVGSAVVEQSADKLGTAPAQNPCADREHLGLPYMSESSPVEKLDPYSLVSGASEV